LEDGWHPEIKNPYFGRGCIGLLAKEKSMEIDKRDNTTKVAIKPIPINLNQRRRPSNFGRKLFTT
jgi:hypothetical protein